MGLRPEHESDELFGVNIRLHDIVSLLCLKPLKQVVQLLAARPQVGPSNTPRGPKTLEGLNPASMSSPGEV